MKKFLFFALVAILTACSSQDKPQLFIEEYSQKLIEQYPNFESNEIAKNAMNDSIAKLCESYVGKEASLLKGVHFRFIRLIENEQKGTHAALFESVGLFCEIESEAGGGKYVIGSPVICVLGTPDEQTAASLSSGEEYFISGVVHAWDNEFNDMIHTPVITPSTINYDLMIMESMTVTKAEKE